MHGVEVGGIHISGTRAVTLGKTRENQNGFHKSGSSRDRSCEGKGPETGGISGPSSFLSHHTTADLEGVDRSAPTEEVCVLKSKGSCLQPDVNQAGSRKPMERSTGN